ncbi:helix-turn-helix domain-containing protein [Sphingomonas sp. ERG5]|uniref:helix-turn-helix domain-containing protein n=1 Tax=Sphingomonas sp. ERG5 TaxID=1381597 RepID=UPI001364C1EB|nr:helix-turn-helix domain-containing protein [Sphingomonas sp. ERG5]
MLPAILADIADVAGEDAALAIAAARGGTQVYFPPVPSDDHWLSKLIGHEAALAVCDRLTCGVGPLRADVPLGPAGRAAKAREMVDTMLREGRSERDIALATGYTTRGVRMRRAGLDDRQLTLF